MEAPPADAAAASLLHRTLKIFFGPFFCTLLLWHHTLKIGVHNFYVVPKNTPSKQKT